MGITRETGYSASIEGYLVVGGRRFRLAKTNGVSFVLADECELAPETEAELLIIVDGVADSKRVALPDGVQRGQRCVQYADVVPF